MSIDSLIKICPNCGLKNSMDNNFCEECRTSLEFITPKKEEEKNTKLKSYNKNGITFKYPNRWADITGTDKVSANFEVILLNETDDSREFYVGTYPVPIFSRGNFSFEDMETFLQVISNKNHYDVVNFRRLKVSNEDAVEMYAERNPPGQLKYTKILVFTKKNSIIQLGVAGRKQIHDIEEDWEIIIKTFNVTDEFNSKHSNMGQICGGFFLIFLFVYIIYTVLTML